MKESTATVLCFTAFGLLAAIIYILKISLDVPNFVDLGGGGYVASFMLSWRIYRWAVSGRPSGAISEEAHTTWIHCFSGIVLYIAAATAIWQSDLDESMQLLLAGVCVVVIASSTYLFHGDAMDEIRAANRDDA